MNGHVSLVGAGPGDPALLTRLAVSRLRTADLVLYDALVDGRTLRLARKARRFFVGKRAGRQAMSQAAIHALMIRAARRGQHVVRLKGGDPFVFGRGAEEALALRAAGVRFDIVPGVSSATAAPAAAGIPVTHRGLASGFLVVSGHDEAALASVAGPLAGRAVTIVIVMGLARQQALARALVGAGWNGTTAAAIIVGASTEHQRQWRGTLDGLLTAAPVLTGEGPRTIVVGDVAALECVATVMPSDSSTCPEERAYVGHR